MISFQKLKIIYNNELDLLKDAINNSKNPYHTFTLSSINNNIPELRTIVLRGIDKDPFKIFFNSDVRSPKIKQLKINNHCSILFYDLKRKMQLRLQCKAFIFNKDDISEEIWYKTPLQSRKCYMAPYPPSKKIENWEPNLPKKYLKKDPTRKDSEVGYKNFSYIQLEVINSDILQLHHDGHIRFIVHKKTFSFISS